MYVCMYLEGVCMYVCMYVHNNVFLMINRCILKDTKVFDFQCIWAYL
jgi:hypothetical protein